MPIAKTVTNFYPAESVQAMTELLDTLRTTCGLIEEGNAYLIQVTPDSSDTGKYRMEVNVVDGVSGLSINLDGQPLLNEPRPNINSAETQLNSIFSLYHLNRGSGRQELIKIAEGENKIILRKTRMGQAELVIIGPSSERLVKMLKEDAETCYQLMSRILDATYPQ